MSLISFVYPYLTRDFTAGLPINAIKGSKTCCYVGAFGGDYRDLLMHDNDDLGQYAVSGLWCALTANRVSWFFDLKGPSMTLDSACSSSLVALHLTCQSILRGESQMVRKSYSS